MLSKETKKRRAKEQKERMQRFTDDLHRMKAISDGDRVRRIAEIASSANASDNPKATLAKIKKALNA